MRAGAALAGEAAAAAVEAAAGEGVGAMMVTECGAGLVDRGEDASPALPMLCLR